MFQRRVYPQQAAVQYAPDHAFCRAICKRRVTGDLEHRALNYPVRLSAIRKGVGDCEAVRLKDSRYRVGVEAGKGAGFR